MNNTQRLLDFKVRPKIRLSEIRRIIDERKIIIPPLSKDALIALCEDGTLETAGGKATRYGWLVYVDSFLEWLNSIETGVGRR